MAEGLRILPVGRDGLLVELDGLDEAMALFDGLRAAPPAGVVEMVPAARTVMIRFDRFTTDRTRIVEHLSRIDLATRRPREGDLHEIPVTYDGEDLGEVAALLGWTVAEVIRRHTQATFTVAFTGFAPGFAYMSCDDPGFDVPRRKSPRLRVLAGSVAVAGRFGGIYPSDSPGGWRILGSTPLKMWDVSRPRPALLAPGDRVRFRDMAEGASVCFPAESERQVRLEAPAGLGLHVRRCDRPVLYQDGGRAGHADQGVAESGALDRQSLAEANLCVGNAPDAAALEIAYGGFSLRAEAPVTLAVAGAPCPLTIRTQDGRTIAAPLARPLAFDAGDEVNLDGPPEGVCSYLALRGGFAVEPVLGSAARDILAKVGPSPLQAGDVLIPANRRAAAVDPCRPPPERLPRAGEVVTLDIVLGPRTDWFIEKSVETLLAQDWLVTADSSRIGMRLKGDQPIEWKIDTELPSEGTATGAIQIPHSGQPVLFLRDHPVTGGYPVIAVVAGHHLDRAGQTPIGARIRFNLIAGFDSQNIGNRKSSR